MWARCDARGPTLLPPPSPGAGNLQHGGLQLVCQACGVLGCFRFVEGHYLLLVTKKAHLATVAGGRRRAAVGGTGRDCGEGQQGPLPLRGALLPRRC